ncbi:hypothetical protein AB5J62_36105 [Amycolatopsis sp. cg5]|uniref:hypothetical protein n=1 Tax=Amycolatopsis sp. cg5 TaxID=3238802 RepID=UPI0035244514
MLFSAGPAPTVHKVVNNTNSAAIAFTGQNCTGQAVNVPAGATVFTQTALAGARFAS